MNIRQFWEKIEKIEKKEYKMPLKIVDAFHRDLDHPLETYEWYDYQSLMSLKEKLIKDYKILISSYINNKNVYIYRGGMLYTDYFAEQDKKYNINTQEHNEKLKKEEANV